MSNLLFYGDNLKVMRRRLADESVDLVYLDPPFKSDENYNLLFREPDGNESPAQMAAFEDTWKWDDAAQEAYEDVIANGPPRVAELVRILRQWLGPNDMMAYLCMMAPRLVEMHRVMKPTGSLYLHCDPNASHYLKVLLDAVFLPVGSFKRELIWRIGWVSGFKTKANNWVRNHETIFLYTKSADYTFNKQFKPYTEDYERRGTGKPSGSGIPFDDVLNIGDEPMNLTSIMIMSYSNEKMSYPTQKPLNLLRLLIRASSNEGDVVLDPFCGCGTTIVAAEMEGRKWIGIDVTHLAIGLNKYRLEASFGSGIHRKYEVHGEPTDVPSAVALAKQDRHEFQAFAMGLVRGRRFASDAKKGPDKGIDGVVYFIDDVSGSAKRVVCQVKSGANKVTVTEMRELIAVVQREGAEMGLMVAFDEPTRDATKEAITAGSYISPLNGKRYQRIQSITVGELLEGGRIEVPGKVVLPNTRRLEPEQQKELNLIQGSLLVDEDGNDLP